MRSVCCGWSNSQNGDFGIDRVAVHRSAQAAVAMQVLPLAQICDYGERPTQSLDFCAPILLQGFWLAVVVSKS